VSATRRTPRKTTTRRRTTARRTTARRTTSRTARRRTPRLATTLGAALGAVIVSLVTDMGWPMRIVVIVVALLAAVGYLLWSHRAEIAAGAEQEASATDEAPPTDPTTSPRPPADREQP
jgi:hypothetical protein